MKKRVIPIILVRDFGVVKTIQFDEYRPLGVPVNFARVYNFREVDELVLLDIDASRFERNIDYEMIYDISEECYMPLAAGGGINTIENVKQVIQNGADKVTVNTEALRNPDFVTEVAAEYGKQCITVSVDVKRVDGKFMVFSNGAKKETGLEMNSWLETIQEKGAGEILLTSIDHEGKMEGYDLEMIESIPASIKIPIIVNGGAGKVEDFLAPAQFENVTGLACASIFHYTQVTPNAIRDYLAQQGVSVRST